MSLWRGETDVVVQSIISNFKQIFLINELKNDIALTAGASKDDTDIDVTTGITSFQIVLLGSTTIGE